jgi:ubiquinone/menaquinone biosynthesis C-methylase UbiE
MSELLDRKEAVQKRLPAKELKTSADLYQNLGRVGRYLSTRCFCPGLRALAAQELNYKGRVVYDMCCGNGENFRYLRQAVGESGRIYASDVTAGMVADAKARCLKHGLTNISVEHRDAHSYVPPELPDGILMSFCYNVLPRRHATVLHAWSMLKPGGKLVLIDAKVPDALEFLVPRVEDLVFKLVGANAAVRPWEEIPLLLGQQGKMLHRMFDTHYLCSFTKPRRVARAHFSRQQLLEPS